MLRQGRLLDAEPLVAQQRTLRMIAAAQREQKNADATRRRSNRVLKRTDKEMKLRQAAVRAQRRLDADMEGRVHASLQKRLAR